MEAWLFSGFLLEVVYIAAILYYLQIISSAVERYLYRIFQLSFYLYEYITNSQLNQPPVGIRDQLLEQCTSIAGVMGWNPVQGCIFFFSCAHTCDGLSFINVPSYFTLETYK